jgi:hypothetical protein
VRRRALIVGIVVSFLMALSCVALLYGGRTATRTHHEQAGRVLADYLDRVQRGDYREAYAMLCNDTLIDYTEEDHARFLRQQPDIVAFNVAGDPFVRSNFLDGTDLVYQVESTHSNAATTITEFVVELVGDGATVCDSPYDRSPPPTG